MPDRRKWGPAMLIGTPVVANRTALGRDYVYLRIGKKQLDFDRKGLQP